MTKFKNGLFVGKFVAYHKGHQSCINHFSSLCENLNVVLCTKPSDRIPGTIRKKWLEQDLKYNVNKEIHRSQNIQLYHLVEDHIPLYPDGLIQWCNAIRDLVGKFDIMFGNEDYVVDCAKVFKSEYYIPDMNREGIQVSSTKILDSQLKHYDLLSTVAKPYFNKVVNIVGADHTGKTTLGKQLAAEYGGFFIEEFGRTYYENEILKGGYHGLNDWKIEDFENSATNHTDIINLAKKKPFKMIFTDVSSLFLESHANLYLKQSSDILKENIKMNKFDQNILLSTEGLENVNIQNEYIKEAQSKHKYLVNRELANLYLDHSLQYFKQNFRSFSNINGYDARFDSIRNHISKSFMI